jgi:hypothetical protein
VSCAQGRLVNEAHARETHAHEVHAHEARARETHAHEIHAHEAHAHQILLSRTYVFAAFDSRWPDVAFLILARKHAE